jgi:isochorismate hydrolase
MSENVNDAKRGFLKTAMLGVGALGAATPGAGLAQTRISSAPANDLALSGEDKLPHRRAPTHQDGPTKTRRVIAESCAGAIIDVQDYFLSQLGSRTARKRMEAGTLNFARLLGYFRIPIIATLERPVDLRGSLPAVLEKQLSEARLFEKNFFDLTKEKIIRDHLTRLKKKQVIIAGCETDVCVLQSCLGLIDLGYQVFVVEDLVFSWAHNVRTALARMQAEGAIFLTYNTLYYELLEAGGGRRLDAEGTLAAFGPSPVSVR